MAATARSWSHKLLSYPCFLCANSNHSKFQSCVSFSGFWQHRELTCCFFFLMSDTFYVQPRCQLGCMSVWEPQAHKLCLHKPTKRREKNKKIACETQLLWRSSSPKWAEMNACRALAASAFNWFTVISCSFYPPQIAAINSDKQCGCGCKGSRCTRIKEGNDFQTWPPHVPPCVCSVSSRKTRLM